MRTHLGHVQRQWPEARASRRAADEDDGLGGSLRAGALLEIGLAFCSLARSPLSLSEGWLTYAATDWNFQHDVYGRKGETGGKCVAKVTSSRRGEGDEVVSAVSVAWYFLACEHVVQWASMRRRRGDEPQPHWKGLGA